MSVVDFLHFENIINWNLFFNCVNQILNEKFFFRNDIFKNHCSFLLSDSITFESFYFDFDVSFYSFELRQLTGWTAWWRAAGRGVWITNRRIFFQFPLSFKTLLDYWKILGILICLDGCDWINFMDAIKFKYKFLIFFQLVLLSSNSRVIVNLINFKFFNLHFLLFNLLF